MGAPSSLRFLPRGEGTENAQRLGGQRSGGEAGCGAGCDGTDPRGSAGGWAATSSWTTFCLHPLPRPQPVGFSPEVTNTLFWLKLVSQEASNQSPGASGKGSGWAVEDTCLSRDSSLCAPQLLLFVLRKVPLARSGCLAQPFVGPRTGEGVLCCPLLSGRLHHRLPQV